jgi:hypothetical protein
MSRIRVVRPPSKLIALPPQIRAGDTSDTFDVWAGYTVSCPQPSACTFKESFIDYTEPHQYSTVCSGDWALVWDGLGGDTTYGGADYLGQDGTAPWSNNFMPAHEV